MNTCGTKALSTNICKSILLSQVFLFSLFVSTHAVAADIKLTGAEATLGLGGGYTENSWNDLTLTAHGEGAYSLKLFGTEGRLRTGLSPFTASLEIPAGNGLRQRHLRLPIFSSRAVQLELWGQEGKRTVELQPLPGPLLLGQRIGELGAGTETTNELIHSDPAMWLGVNELQIAADSEVPTAIVLAALAAGTTVVRATNILPNLRTGKIGLGQLKYLTQNSFAAQNQSAKLLQTLVNANTPTLPQPTHQATQLAWWAAILLVLAVLWFAYRPSQDAWWLSSILAVVAAGVGFFGLSIANQDISTSSKIKIGARGWGIETTVVQVMSTTSKLLLLPASAKANQTSNPHYTDINCQIQTLAWQSHVYWLAPKATLLELRVSKNKIYNSSGQTIKNVFIVGYGKQEPLPAKSSHSIAEDSPLSDPSTLELAALLPKGTAIWKHSTTKQVTGIMPEIMIALPEDS